MGGPGFLVEHGDVLQVRLVVRVFELLLVAARHVRGLRILAVDEFQPRRAALPHIPDFPGVRGRHFLFSPPAFFLEDRCKLVQEPLFRPAFLDRRINRAPDVLEKIQLGDATVKARACASPQRSGQFSVTAMPFARK